MRPYCEVVVKDVLPAVRSILAEELTNAGLKQEDVARKLYLTQPAVSHYLKKARGKNVKILRENNEVNKYLKKTAEDLIAKKARKYDIVLKFCDVCKVIRKTRVICRFHKGVVQGLTTCDICIKKDIC